MKSRTAMVALMLCAAVAVFGSEYEPTIASGSSPLFAESLERAVGALKGEIRKQRSPVAGRAARGAAAVAEDTTGMWNCTQFEGCWEMVTQGGISCDYSLCEGCPGQTAYGNYTCSAVMACGVLPTQGSGPTCSGWLTCGSCNTAQAGDCSSTSANVCGTFSGSTCASTCSAQQCPTSGGTACATQLGSTCDQFCGEPTTASNCEVPTHRPDTCGTTMGWECDQITTTSLCEFPTQVWECTQQ